MFDTPIAPMLLFRWLVSFFNIEYCLETRTLHWSLIKVNLWNGEEKNETPKRS